MDVYFADSLSLFKALIKSAHPSLKNCDGTFPKPNQSALYNTLFNDSFSAHDALEDVLALRKILFCSRLELSTETIIDHSSPVSTHDAAEDLVYLDRRNGVLQSFRGKLFNAERDDGVLRKTYR